MPQLDNGDPTQPGIDFNAVGLTPAIDMEEYLDTIRIHFGASGECFNNSVPKKRMTIMIYNPKYDKQTPLGEIKGMKFIASKDFFDLIPDNQKTKLKEAIEMFWRNRVTGCKESFEIASKLMDDLANSGIGIGYPRC